MAAIANANHFVLVTANTTRYADFDELSLADRRTR